MNNSNYVGTVVYIANYLVSFHVMQRRGINVSHFQGVTPIKYCQN